MVDDILFPENKTPQRKRHRRRPVQKRHTFLPSMKFLFLLVLVLVVAGVSFLFADIGGNIALNIAKDHLSKNYHLELNAEKITGNPLRGYTLHNFELIDTKKGNELFSAAYLSVKLNLAAIVTGNLRLSQVSLGGVNMNVDDFVSALSEFQMPKADLSSQNQSSNFGVAPAYAEDDKSESLPEIPIDTIILSESRFSSKFGVIDVNEIKADVPNLDIDVDGKINGLPLKGNIDMGESAGLTAANRAELSFCSGKILATGGLMSGKLDLHISAEDVNLSEATALYPSLLVSKDFDGNADFTADITGNTDSPKFSGSFSFKGTKIYGFPVERASSNLSYSNNRVSVSNIQANAFNVPVQGEIAAAFRPNEPVSVMVKLDGSEASLNGLDEVLGVPELKALKGKISLFSVNISGPVNALSGLVNFNAPRVAYDGRALTNIRAQMKLSKSDTANVDGKFTFEGASGYLNGSIAKILTKPNMNLTAKIADLDIKRIESMIPDAPQYKLNGKITASVTVKGTSSNPKVTGSLNSEEFSGWDQKIVKPSVNFSFANNTLTLIKTEGTLNGMPVNLTGTVSPLPSSNPKLNINATITMTPSALKNYVPDIDSYKIKGTVNAGLKIQGTADNPSVNLLATSPNLEAMDMINAKNLELTTALNGDLAKLERLNVNVAAKSLTAGGATFTGVNANVSKNGDKITLAGLNAKSGQGTVTGSGTASVSGKSPLDFNFNFDSLALAPLASASGVDLKGNLSGKLKVSGQNTNPSINFSANIPELNAVGFSLSNLTADIDGNMESINLKNVRAFVEGSEISATGNIQITPSMKMNVSLNGKNINLAQLLKDYPAMKGKIAGTAGLTFTLTGNEKSMTGKGSLTVPSLTAFGMKLTGVNLPLNYSGTNFTSKGGSAKLYGGTMKNTLTFNTSTMKFTDNIEANGVDVNGLIQDASGGLEGKITGTGKLTFKVTGSAKDKVSYSGSGNFSMGQGAVTGFKWLDLFTMIHKSNGLRYSNVNAPLSLQTGKLIVKAGAVANAMPNDALYKYAKLSQNGTINFGGTKTTMDFPIESNVNYQLINAIQGGTKGGLEALLKGGVSGFEDNVKAFLSGGLTEARKTASTGDFRVVTLRVHGNVDDLKFSNLKIGPSTVTPQTVSNDKATATSKPKNIQDTLKEKLTDEINKRLNIDIKPKTNQTQQSTTTQKQNQTQQSTKTQQQSQSQNIRQKAEERLKEELQKGIQKGLGELFRR